MAKHDESKGQSQASQQKTYETRDGRQERLDPNDPQTAQRVASGELSEVAEGR